MPDKISKIDNSEFSLLLSSPAKAVTRKTWQEFRNTGLLWWINMILHTFGWAIVCEVDTDNGEIKSVFPARVTYRGFKEADNTEGYQKVSAYLKDNAGKLLEESLE